MKFKEIESLPDLITWLRLLCFSVIGRNDKREKLLTNLKPEGEFISNETRKRTHSSSGLSIDWGSRNISDFGRKQN